MGRTIVSKKDIEAMDQAAVHASVELENLNPSAVKAVAQWLKRNYPKTGYKRLGRLLIAKAVEGDK